ncbi:MAG: MarR family transcriptional regulator [Sphaerochaetaceae bacterium]|nr:MarR family transcriptional regulator [Sphaerochaetaceae bacterium]
MLDLCGLRKLICDINETENHMKRELGLTVNEASILCVLSDGVHKNTQIAKKMNLSVSRVSRLTSAVEKKGFVLREVEDADKRGICFYLTDKGDTALYELNNCKSCLPSYIEKAIKEGVETNE